MEIYGADFSGARDPNERIYYSRGYLKENTLHVKDIVPCDDRLDLFAAINHTNSPWGLDFPFSLSHTALEALGIKSWQELLDKVVGYSRKEYNNFIADNGIAPCESICQEASVCCRATDAAAKSYSPLKKTNPNMRVMTYAGLKLLSYLRKSGNAVYPFDHLNDCASRLYEVYPSHTWKQLNLPRSRNLELFVENFYKKFNLRIEIPNDFLEAESLDAADAAVACATIAFVINNYEFENDWLKKYKWMRNNEWKKRQVEGLIVRCSVN